MGGLGSGRHRLSKKTTVEDCWTLDINDLLRHDLLNRSWGEVRWYRGGVGTACVNYTLKGAGFKEREPTYVLTLHPSLFRQGRWIPVTQDIPLLSTELHSGGRRYWFSCPNCRQRVGRLHLPRGANRFLCRNCYDLTYVSCQESHKFDSLYLKMGIPPWVGRRWLRRSMKEMVLSPVYGGE